MKKQIDRLFLVLLTAVFMAGCGSGGGDEKKPPAGQSVYLYGIASKGPINKGFVAVYPLNADGSQGNLIGNSLTQEDGSYVVDIGPYNGNVLVEVRTGDYTDEATKENRTTPTLRAALTQVKGNAVVMVTPFTEIAVRKALFDGSLTETRIKNANAFVGALAGGLDIINTRPADVLDAADCATASSDEITYGLALATLSEMIAKGYGKDVSDVMAKIHGDIQDDRILNGQGVLLKDALQAFLDNPNNLTGIADFDRTEVDDAIDLLSESDILTDNNEINQVFRTLESMYAPSNPSQEALKAWFDSHVAGEYLHDGRGKEDELAAWAGEGGLYPGVSLSIVILDTLDVLDPPYVKGYRIKVYHSGTEGWGGFPSAIVFDGTNWLWFGNHEWGVGVGNFLPKAEMTADAEGDVSLTTGFEVVVWDNNLYTYHQGGRSAIITGPGLPEEGVKLQHYYPESYFGLYPPGAGFTYPLEDDNVIASIPDNAEYTVHVYQESVNDVSLSNAPIRTETRTIAKRPFLNAELNASLFPALTSPGSHNLADAHIPGSLEVSWTNPDQMAVDFASLSWLDEAGEDQFLPKDVVGGTSTVTFDTAEGYLPAVERAQLHLRGTDSDGRRFSFTHRLWEQTGTPDDDAVNEVFRGLEALYADAVPSETDLSDWFNTHVADDFLQDGIGKTVELAAWNTGGGLYEGVSLYVVLLDPLDVSITSYQKGYRIKIFYSGTAGSGSFLSTVVFDGTDWLWYGNREWGLSLGNFLPKAEMTVDTDDAVSFKTGFEVIIWDNYLYAYDQGAQSAIITGPGFPTEGVKLEHCYDASTGTQPYFGLSPSCTGFLYSIEDDTVIAAIPDNAEYVVHFYTTPAADVTLSDVPVRTETRTITRRPILNSELNASRFPVLISPSSHDLSAANIPGPLEVVWTNPADMAVDFVSLGWLTLEGQESQSRDVTEGATLATFDTTDYPPALFIAQLTFRSTDTFGRRYSLTWPFSDFSVP